MRRYCYATLFILFLVFPLLSNAQFSNAGAIFTHADSLRGELTPLRANYDVNYYHLDVKFDIVRKFITGSNKFRFRAVHDLSRLQFDLFANLKVDRIIYKGKELAYQRDANAVFISFPETIPEGKQDEFTVFYSGNPVVAKHAPWDGESFLQRIPSGGLSLLPPVKVSEPVFGGRIKITFLIKLIVC